MYKLLIVDDEPLVQVGIKSMLDWKSLDIEITGIASNGQAALSMIEDNFPDIVITDIKMPILSGLELARACMERYEDRAPAFIILTSYEDFAYAKEALTCRVSDYLVKLELTPEILKSSVERIIKKLEKENRKKLPASEELSLSYFQDKFYTRLLHNLFESRSQFQLQAQELHLSFDYVGYVCCYLELVGKNSEQMPPGQQLQLFHTAFQMSRELFSKYQCCHTIMLDLKHFSILFCYENDAGHDASDITRVLNAVGTSLNNYYSVHLYAGVGTWVTDPLGITESYQYSRDAFSNTSAEKPVVFFDECKRQERYKKSFNISIFKDALAKAYEEYDGELLDKTLTDIITLFQSHSSDFLQAMDCASNILYLSISLLPDGENVVSAIFSDSPDSYRSLYKMSSTEQIIDWLTHFREALCAHFSAHRHEIRKPIVSQVRNYIKEHIREHLSLNEVAGIFGISPNYLSQLFKKYNDVGYNDFVTQCKIDEAKKLLKTSDYKVYEIAELLGFESAFYFSKVFKKVVGVPPTEYMQKS